MTRAERPETMFVLLAETFQALGDTSRVQNIWTLAQAERCVNDIAERRGLRLLPQVSPHLRLLRNLPLVKKRKEGRSASHSLDDPHIESILCSGFEHIEERLP